MSLTKFAKLCRRGAIPGYALDQAEWIKHATIEAATETVSSIIEYCMEEIKKGWGRPIKKFYIGKTYVYAKSTSDSFSAKDPATWRLDGISSRYSHHVSQEHGENGLIVLAVVTKEFSPKSYKYDIPITNHEEYALTLEKGLIERFREAYPDKLANKTTNQGCLTTHETEAFVVYMTFTVNDAPGYHTVPDVGEYWLASYFSQLKVCQESEPQEEGEYYSDPYSW